ncbi:heme oxygenase [Methylopila jiangsuensis]|uniref:Heme oxygenase n=1 Tax=Methylopila jiangsuensis TaxID=586230 RepID=A0A9W6JHP9_9HYPH|nr:biliverdin-producing heme oxygenase [Methylopila jiangsuensis]MDR6285970.1 heme oxygenase [Methylopila jiangsuensis]GLK75728.1 heme oxygenase [Methylopila jiangsuensis]
METLDLVSHGDSLSKRLKADTAAQHEELDAAIMAGRPFASLDLYGRFLDVQRSFHRDIDELYGDPELIRLLPGLPALRRLPLIVQDLADLGLPSPEDADAPVFAQGETHDVAEALGWLYVAEGSNLGAAFLLKRAAGLGLSESFGARHLAPAAEGRGLSWRTFAAALDAAPLGATGAARASRGAQAAFARIRGRVAKAF